MGEQLTMDEIRTTYPDEWILIENPQLSESKQVLSGTVRFHSTKRSEIYQQVRETGPRVWAMVFTGKFPRNQSYAISPMSVTRKQEQSQ